MPEWLIERGIGETRFALVEDGEIVEARIALDGLVPSGSRLAARLTATGINGRNAIATDEQGTEYLLPRGAPGVSEGASMHLEVTRSAIPGSEPWKRPLARFAADADAEPAAPGGRDLPFPAPKDQLASLGWNELVEQAHSGVVRFAGGELSIEGNASHGGTEEEAVVCIGGDGPTVTAAIFSSGVITVYAGVSSYDAITRCIKDWITQVNSRHRDRLVQPANVRLARRP